ncbi:hypothetical protein [Actinosynnema sp. ALI-1.44]|uniref:hypothetical protein n=1 Tax=Actinosynnema sp. ALI-1.44 TaxID=1933779 RepID=UPI0011783B85|nr:hypothetical protein [Actinosynnema sp. ALI-1.44]
MYVDALPPHPGHSWFDTAPPEVQARLRALAVDGLLPPWHEWFPPDVLDLPDGPEKARFLAEIPRVPLAYFGEPAPDGADVPSGYLQLSDAYRAAADEAERRGWWVHRENAHHLAMLTQPSRVADLITRFAGAPGSWCGGIAPFRR